MRIAYDATVSARARTGVEQYARRLFPALRAAGADVVWWQHPLAAHLPGRRVVNGARLASWLAWGAARRARREGVDVLHATTSIGPVRHPCPVVLTVHDATPVTHPLHRGAGDRAFQRVFSVEAARRAAAVLAPTQSAAQAIAEHYRVDPSRIHVVPLGVADAFRQVTPDGAARIRSRYGLTRPFVLFVGANTPRKNLPRLLDAMRIVVSRHPDVEFVIAGPVAPGIDRQAAAPWVRPLGFVPDADLPGLYAAASCLAYVSLCEGFGLPVVEAMAAGVPVVTSNVSAMPEVAGGAAHLVDPQASDAIAAGILRVLEDTTLRSALVQHGRDRSLAFDWRQTATRTIDVYRLACGGSYSSRVALSPGPESAPSHSPSALAP